jgi:hypothetical protein
MQPLRFIDIHAAIFGLRTIGSTDKSANALDLLNSVYIKYFPKFIQTITNDSCDLEISMPSKNTK